MNFLSQDALYLWLYVSRAFILIQPLQNPFAFIIVQSRVMINKQMGDQFNCTECHSVLDSIGTQAYCPQCLASTPNLQQEVRVVPEHYQSNCANKRELEQQRKFNSLIRQFSDKHRELTSKHELEFYREKLRAVKALTVNRKGSREAAAVVIFCQMQEEIKMTIRQYCKSNNLNIKLFNQKYKVYRSLEKKEAKEVDFFKFTAKIQLKEEENYHKIEQSPTERQSEEYFYSQSEQKRNFQNEKVGLVERAEHAISLIYEKVFNKYIYKDKKHVVVRGLLEKFGEIDQNVLREIKYEENTPFKIYYLIFAVLKALGHRITFMDYTQIIQKETGYSLKRKPATLVRKIYQKVQKVEGKEPNNLQHPFPVKMEENSIEFDLKDNDPKERKVRKSRKKEKERVDFSDSELEF